MKKALLIGINYVNNPSLSLSGCHRDIDMISEVLKMKGYTSIQVMKDGVAGSIDPSRQNIITQLTTFITNSKKGETLYFHYSGHGSHIHDQSGDEVDGRDEVIIPTDYPKIISDDELFVIISKLPQGVKLRVTFDCCHSGTILDLPFLVSGKQTFSVQNRIKLARKNIPDMKQDVIMISGCMDHQTSAESLTDRGVAGALTWALTGILKKNTSIVGWFELLEQIRKRLAAAEFDQYPQLSYSKKSLSNTAVDI